MTITNEQAFDNGYLAFLDGFKQNDCPHSISKCGDINYLRVNWLKGWRLAQSEQWQQNVRDATFYDIYGGDRP